MNRLNEEKTRQYLADAFRDGSMSDIGTGLPALMPKKSLFAKKESGGENRTELKNRIFALLKCFFDKYFGICSFDDAENAETEDHAKNIYQLTKQIDGFDVMNMAADKKKGKDYK